VLILTAMSPRCFTRAALIFLFKEAVLPVLSGFRHKTRTVWLFKTLQRAAVGTKYHFTFQVTLLLSGMVLLPQALLLHCHACVSLNGLQFCLALSEAIGPPLGVMGVSDEAPAILVKLAKPVATCFLSAVAAIIKAICV
jgi:hypothetical protein